MRLLCGYRNHFDNQMRKTKSYAILLDMPQLKNRRHEIFALELATGAPLLSAYLAAGYKDSYSARFNASRLRNKIRERVNELLQEHGERSRIKAEWVQEQIAPLLEVDPGELYEAPDPNDPDKLKLKPLSALPSRIRKAITRIRIDPETNYAVEVFLSDKIGVANALLRSLPDGSNDRATSVGVQQFNFSWGAAGDISNDIPLQIAAEKTDGSGAVGKTAIAERVAAALRASGAGADVMAKLEVFAERQK